MPEQLVAIVPVHDGGDDIRTCVAALRRADLAGDRIIVVDDASTDGAARQAATEHGCRYLWLPGKPSRAGGTPGPGGPARARNRGAASTDADILLFVDADVEVHEQAARRFRELFEERAELSAAFGSYDDRPSDSGWISRYKNLLHHRMHQGGPRPATTFWSGCGAVRSAVFARHGGFDESYRGATIEDIEFGMRLHAANEPIEVRPEILCTHHKRWTLRGWLRTDILGRALPWSRLLVARASELPDTLNLSTHERLTAVIVCCMPPLLLSLVSGVLPVMATGLLGAAFLGFLWLQRDLLVFFCRHGGVRFGIAAGAMHIAYYLYASATFALVRLRLV